MVGYFDNRHLPASCSPASLIENRFDWVWPILPAGAGPWVLGPGGWLTCLASLQVAAEYFKNTTLLLVGVICVAAAVEKWNLHKRIALRMVLMAGAKPGM